MAELDVSQRYYLDERERLKREQERWEQDRERRHKAFLAGRSARALIVEKGLFYAGCWLVGIGALVLLISLFLLFMSASPSATSDYGSAALVCLISAAPLGITALALFCLSTLFGILNEQRDFLASLKPKLDELEGELTVCSETAAELVRLHRKR